MQLYQGGQTLAVQGSGRVEGAIIPQGKHRDVCASRGEHSPPSQREVASQASDPHPRCFALP